MTPHSESHARAVWKAALAPTPDCILIEKLTGPLTDSESRHLAACPRCQTELALWHAFDESTPRAEEGAAAAWVAQELRRRAAAPAVRKPAWWQRWLPVPAYRPAGALAALILLAGGVMLYRIGGHTALTPQGTGEGAYRSQSVAVSAPVGDVDQAPEELRWQPVAGAATYEAEILEVDRHSLWKSQTSETRLVIPASIRGLMSPGKTLIWEVTARNSSRAAIATSGVQRFRVKIKRSIGGDL